MRLQGWKAIASYIGCTERTAQRWAKKGLPVHRLNGISAAVFGRTDEIDAWSIERGGTLSSFRGGQVIEVFVMKDLAEPLPAGRYAITAKVEIDRTGIHCREMTFVPAPVEAPAAVQPARIASTTSEAYR